ncbi:MAG: UDP-N-acetylglucosamine 1-carboxyvinyltransferase [Christensenellaceae bacterium]|nr:UDP-N-acetylglucosamine 1-carboxyvinyltransferase [Christensenellaceae bacterium]
MTEKLVIKGGKPLKGEVSVTGAKNAAVAILPAAVLSEGVCVIDNLPDIADVNILVTILKSVGAKVDFDKESGTMTIDSTHLDTWCITHRLVKRMRASYYFLGAFLARFGKAEVLMPGGCSIGDRPIDLHIKGFENLGARVDIEYAHLKASAEEGLTGSEIYLDTPSVGATINIMIAAVKAKGTTTIVNAAKEPHVVDVANFLTCMGAKIRGAGTGTIVIRGVEKLHGCSYTIIPDQIETGTLMIAAAATRGDVTLTNVIPAHMDSLIAKMKEMGIKIIESADTIRVVCEERPKAVHIKTLPYPGFPTDLQQPTTVLLSTAKGTSVIIESIFESRFKHISEIRRMGAIVNADDRIAVVEGVNRLTGAQVRATDLRAGAALVIAGLMADGETEIYNIKYIDRGYAHIEDKLRHLGAEIERVAVEEDDDYDY